MKSTLALIVTVLTTLIFSPFTGNAQYTITTNTSTSSFGVAFATCSSCSFIISAGVTLTINSSGTCTNCTFTGGIVDVTTNSVNFNGTNNFSNGTVLIDASLNPQNMNFNGDNVTINQSFSYQNGGAVFTNSTINVNADWSFSNASETFTGSTVNVATGHKISLQNTSFTNSTFNFNGSAQMSVNNAMATSGSTFNLHGTSQVTSGGTTTFSGGGILMDGTSTSFTASNALPISNTNITMSNGSTLTASSLTATGGTITTSNTSKINISNAVSLSGTTLTMSNTSQLSGSSFAAASSSAITLNDNAKITSSNAVTLTGSTMAMNNASTITASSATFQTGSAWTMSGTSAFTSSNGIDVNGSNAYLYGSSSASGNNITVENSSNLFVGDGTLASASHIFSNNQLNVLDNSLLKIGNGNNYLQTNANNFQGGSTTFAIKTNTISCNHGAVTGNPHSCASGFVYGCATLNNGGGLACTPLALAGLGLSAEMTSSGSVLASWTDAQPTTAAYYQVQRSAGNNDFTTIATISANDNDNGTYHFNDPAAPSGSLQYRITRVDRDGKAGYSNVASVKTETITATIRVFPNPATNHNFYLATPSTAEWVVNMYTMTGQLIGHTQLKGQLQYTLQLPSQVMSGSAVLVQVIGQTSTRSFTLLVR